MAGLVPAIYVLLTTRKTWMPGTEAGHDDREVGACSPDCAEAKSGNDGAGCAVAAGFRFAPSGDVPLPPQRLCHDLFAALAVLRIGHAGVAAESRLEAVGRMPRHAPSARPHRKLAPVLGVVRHVGRLVDLLDLGGVFDHEAIGLDEIGKHVVARAVA